MARYLMDDGKFFDTERAKQTWKEKRWFDGRNLISQATGTQWDHQELHRSSRGRFCIESWSAWSGSHPSARWVDKEEAARWLIENGEELPDDLASYADALIE